MRPSAKNILNAIDGFLLLTTIMVAMLQPFEASNGLTADTVLIHLPFGTVASV